jgi:putative FmdB family regulatory protein
VPVYDYRCEKGHRFEVVQSMSDTPAQRVLHAPAIHFKGSGFHNTDYGTKNRAKEPAAASGSGSGSAAPSGGSDGGSSSGSGGGKSVGLDKV